MPESALLVTCLPVSRGPEPSPAFRHQELEDAHHAVRQKRRRLPAGTSDYQAAWLLDDDDAGESGSEQEVLHPRTAKWMGHALAGMRPGSWMSASWLDCS